MGEAVTMSQHMEQTAACAVTDGAVEIETFEANPHHHAAVKLRLYDDDGKVAGLTINPLITYRETLESLVSQ